MAIWGRFRRFETLGMTDFSREWYMAGKLEWPQVAVGSPHLQALERFAVALAHCSSLDLALHSH